MLSRLRERLEQAIVEAESAAANAIRDMFRSSQYGGVVPDKDIQVILSSDRWKRMYGNVKKAWNELVRDGFIKKSGANWEWVG